MWMMASLTCAAGILACSLLAKIALLQAELDAALAQLKNQSSTGCRNECSVTARATMPTANSSCQTRCDRDCSHFDAGCKGEAWVCVNLFDVLRSDNGPAPAGPPFENCFEAVSNASVRRALKALARRNLFASEGRAGPSKSISFQREAETLLQAGDGSGRRRRVPHDLLARAVARRWTMNELVSHLLKADCQPRGLGLPRLARERFFNRSWWTFRTKNMHQDAVNFLADLMGNFGTAIDSSSWLGVGIEQDPHDAIAIQQLIVQLQPDLIVETGTFNGGSALFYASILSLVHPAGRVVTIDPWRRRLERSRRKWSGAAERLFTRHVTYFPRSSLDPDVVRKVGVLANRSKRVMVILDSAHRSIFVAKELELYASLVSVGSYLIVEDTKLDRYLTGIEDEPHLPKYWKHVQRWRGPTAAVHDFLSRPAGRGFQVDRGVEPGATYTQHPRGFLKRVQ